MHKIQASLQSSEDNRNDKEKLPNWVSEWYTREKNEWNKEDKELVEKVVWDTKLKAHWVQCLKGTEWLHEPIAKYGDKCSVCGRDKKEVKVISS